MITNELYDLVHAGDLKATVNWLEARPQDLDTPIGEGYSALHVASIFGHEPIVKHLVARGALINQNAANASLATPLHLTVGFRDELVAKQIAMYLLNCGAELNVRQVGGLTPLHHAVSRGSLVLVEMLIDEGADPFLKDDQGVSASDLAKNLKATNEAGEVPVDAIRTALKRAFSLPLEQRS